MIQRRGWPLVLALLLAGCGDDPKAPPPIPPDRPPEDRTPCADNNPLRNPYFGDLHVHTNLSFDAAINGTRLGPEGALRFARGEPVELPAAAGGVGVEVRLDRPLDFVAVTDHAEFLAEVAECTTPEAPGFDKARCETFRAGGQGAITSWGVRLTQPQPSRLTDLCGEDGALCNSGAQTVWSRVIEAAEEAYDRSASCSLTTFVGYEWTGNTSGSNLHRNVIFRGRDLPPQPTSYFDAPSAEALWRALEQGCLDAEGDCDAMVIPHNTNLSNGGIFAPLYPGAQSLDDERALAEQRARLEPLVEIFQHKGGSECNNGLSGLFGDPDELCDIEQLRPAPFDDCGDETGILGIQAQGCVSRYDTVRGTLLGGLEQQARLGVNPFRLGIIASTDTHNATPGATDEATYAGHTGTQEERPSPLLKRQILPFGLVTNPGGLAGVWSRENSRDALFDALRRRETWGTSGTRIAVRLFGGWDLPEDLCAVPDAIEKADASGVPMGGTLPSSPSATGPPRFFVMAMQDPLSAPLSRVEIVKGWLENGELRYRVFEAVSSGEVATVDADTCEAQGGGAGSLCAVWNDPEYVAEQPAFYYARVVENPTCRWSRRLCLSLAEAERPEGCDDPAVPQTIRELAWTSPIWLQ